MSKPKTYRPAAKNPWRPARPGPLRWVIIGVAVVAGVVALVKYDSPSSVPAGPGGREAAPASTFAPTIPSTTPAPTPAPSGMVWIPGGEFSMCSDDASEPLCGQSGVTRDALPIHRVYVDGFWMDATEVTNEQFEKFVKATGYVTGAEQKPRKEEFPIAPPETPFLPAPPFSHPRRNRCR